MSDRTFTRINAGWALGFDDRQWLLQRHKGQHRSGAKAGQDKWQAVSFVSSTKTVLASVMREKGVPADDAQHVLAMLPDTFREFIQARQSGDRNMGHSAIEAPAAATLPEGGNAGVRHANDGAMAETELENAT